MREGEAPVKKHARKSLRLLGSVGEPINPEAWLWYHRVVGEGRCPIVDTWWQTETGGILITPLPGATRSEAGLGDAAVLRRQPRSSMPKATARRRHLRQPRAADSWPGQMRTVYGDHQRFVETYFSHLSGHVLHRRRLPPRRGRLLLDHRPRRRRDQRLRPPHGHRRSRKRAGRHPKVAEAAVVGYPHDIKGQGIYAYVTLKPASSRPTRCARTRRHGCARRSARSPRPTSSSGRPACRRPAPARSCAASCARSPNGCFRPRLCENSPVAGKIQAPVDWCSA
jgi:acetyl-CoA synthetase